MQGLTEDVTLQPRSSRVLGAAVAAIAAITFFGLLLTGRLDLLARGAAPLALLALVAWAAFWRPAVRVGPATVAFANVLKTVEVTWPAVQEVRMQWSLQVVTAGGVFTAWAAPKPTRVASGFAMRRDQWGLPENTGRTVRVEPRATGDIAAMLVQQQWAEYRERGLLGVVEGTGVQVRWHVTTIAAAGLLVVLWVLAVALP